MTKAHKRLKSMANNPQGWRIEDVHALATRYGIECKHDGGSHAIFRSPYGEHLSIPAKRPIKPIYIIKFLELVAQVQEASNESTQE